MTADQRNAMVGMGCVATWIAAGMTLLSLWPCAGPCPPANTTAYADATDTVAPSILAGTAWFVGFAFWCGAGCLTFVMSAGRPAAAKPPRGSDASSAIGSGSDDV